MNISVFSVKYLQSEHLKVRSGGRDFFNLSKKEMNILFIEKSG